MDIQGITTTQILTVGIFLVGLIFLQIFITKNKSKFSSKWGGNKRIHIVEEKALSTTEKIRPTKKIPTVSICIVLIPWISIYSSFL